MSSGGIERRQFILGGLLTLGTGIPVNSAVRSKTVSFEKDNSIFPNPERGFYLKHDPVYQSDEMHAPLKASALRRLRDRPEALTLARDLVNLRAYRDQALPKALLERVAADWNEARIAGVKVIPRFLYDYSQGNDDAVETVMLRHIEQITPLLQVNADVIAWVQGGLFGGSGEGNSSDRGFVESNRNGWQSLSKAGVRIYRALLDAVPKSRMIVLRYPRFKWDLLNGPLAGPPATITESTSFTREDAARIGFYNDGFMGDEDHYAFFAASKEEKPYTEADTRFVIIDGELSEKTNYNRRKGQVIRDMARYHFTSLNIDGDGFTAANLWQKNGDYLEVARRMGYRLRLLSATLPTNTQANSDVSFKLQMTNDGFAAVMNPRRIRLILKSQHGKAEYHAEFDDEWGNRRGLPQPGTTTEISLNAFIPRDVRAGKYQLFLALPDPSPTLSERAEYAIRLANKEIWDPKTGMHSLGGELNVDGVADGNPSSDVAFILAVND